MEDVKYLIKYNDDGQVIEFMIGNSSVQGFIEVTEEEYNKYAISYEDYSESIPTQLDRIEAQVLYTALMTNTLIEGE